MISWTQKCESEEMASLDEFYGGDEGYPRREHAGRRQNQPTVPQFETDGGLFFGSSKNSKPRLLNLDPSKSRNSKEGDANADHYAGEIWLDYNL